MLRTSPLLLNQQKHRLNLDRVPPGKRALPYLEMKVSEAIAAEATHFHASTANMAEYRRDFTPRFRISDPGKIWNPRDANTPADPHGSALGILGSEVELRHSSNG
jgi:hypothetical protein